MTFEEIERNNLIKIFEKGSIINGEYVEIIAYTNGRLLVRRDFDGLYQFIGKDYESDLLFMAHPFKSGYALVKKNARSPYCYLDKNGNYSEEYFEANDYNGDLAVVRYNKNDKEYYFRKGDKVVNCPYAKIEECNDGFHLVRKLECPNYEYVSTMKDLDIDEETYVKADSYKNGFARVSDGISIDFMYRDMLGRVTNEETFSGNYFYLLVNDCIELQDIDKDCFNDPIFKNAVECFLRNSTIEKCDEAINKTDKTLILENYIANIKYLNQLEQGQKQSGNDKTLF